MLSRSVLAGFAATAAVTVGVTAGHATEEYTIFHIGNGLTDGRYEVNDDAGSVRIHRNGGVGIESMLRGGRGSCRGPGGLP